VRKQTLGDFHKEHEGEKGEEKDASKCTSADGINPDAAADSKVDAGDSNIKVIVVDIRHELYGWGRGYHGQLGLRDLKVVQWLPTRVKLKKDPRFKDDDQPTRFAMVTCGEKHTLLLAVNGLIWWSGEKGSVGMRDPNANRKNQFEAKNESASFQYTFAPYFDPTSYGEYNNVKMKFISSNFNSHLNFAITESNTVCVFGVNTPF
jgi:alpha-tubulin suppressor-like RCC1 family protein